MIRFMLWDRDVRDRSELLDLVARELESRRLIDDRQAVVRAFERREALGSTLLTDRLAIPHAQCDSIKRASMVFVTTRLPVRDWHQARRFLFTSLPVDADDRELAWTRDFFIRLADDDFAEALSVCEEKELASLLSW